MRSRYKVYESEAAYFITSTIVEWVPIFTSAGYFDILLSSLRFSQQKKNLKIYAFVIMDNHFHAVVRHPQLSRVMQSIKSYTAAKLVMQLKSDNKFWALFFKIINSIIKRNPDIRFGRKDFIRR